MSQVCSIQTLHLPTPETRSRTVLALPAIFLAGLIFVFELPVGETARGDDKSAKASAKSNSAANSAANSSATDDAADEADLGIDIDLSVLIVPTRIQGKVKDTDQLKFAQELRGLLLEGFKDKSDALEQAKKHFEAAHQLPVHDPRAAYAYGVVLLAQDKAVAALEQFRAAGRLKKAPFLPALQGIAWTGVSHGDHAQALPALLDLARRLEDSQELWPAAEDKEQSAAWLGSMVGFLSGPFLAGPGNAAAQASQIKKLAIDVAGVLTAERKLAYERCRKEAAARYVEIKALAARPMEVQLAEANQQREKNLAAAEAAVREAKQIEDELRWLKKPHDRQLTDLTRDIHENAMKIKTTASRVAAAEVEIEELSEPKKHASLKSSNSRRQTTLQKVIRNENAGEKKIRESQLAAAQRRLDNIQSSLEEARQAVANARKQRDEAQVDYRKDTAGKRQALHAAQQKAAELSICIRDAKRGAPTPEQLQARVTALETYVPLYPAVEKDRLLASLKPLP